MSSRQGHIRRPMNSFMVWSREKRCEILKSNPGMSNAVISKKLGMTWKGMTAEDKKPYIEEAKRLTWKHKQDHPDYKYRPRRHSKGKNRNKCDASSLKETGIQLPSEWSEFQNKPAHCTKQQPVLHVSTFQHDLRPVPFILPDKDTARLYLSYPGRTSFSPFVYSAAAPLSSSVVCVNDVISSYGQIASIKQPVISMTYKSSFSPTLFSNPLDRKHFVLNGQVR
ncbi:transcription factor Sox-18A-like [Xenia sp. Carnegie-2017]|uniref:transcription factor Sox-18A-like n=1 Tax=Xenia sp. Carnegie-2017 TaxID=2897299 RepID=UPI001F03FA44|nr:transcription factor Sox-18A-like [Xenia sp. Carnegie-2017]